VVTGTGVLCALGSNSAECWSALREGRSGIAPIQSVEMTGLRFQKGAEAHGFRAEDHFEASRCDLIDRFAQFAVVAARQAVSEAGLDLSGPARARVAVITGTSMGGQASLDRGFVAIYKEGKPRPHPFTIPLTMYNAGASQISMDLGSPGRRSPSPRPALRQPMLSDRHSGWCVREPLKLRSAEAARHRSVREFCGRGKRCAW
jgi:nodulation protein E